MNGGVDGMINTPNSYIQEYVKLIINDKFYGKLPVGQSILIPTQHPTHRYLIYTPTMRVAEDVSNSLNAYLAFRSSLVLMKNNKITSASIPIFCTGAGCMDIVRAYEQMKEAYLSVKTGNLINGNWKIYHEHHRFLNKL
jgi:O-acetyl-ADP-ribose deacetylase (regulator of RNase III)